MDKILKYAIETLKRIIYEKITFPEITLLENLKGLKQKYICLRRDINPVHCAD
jgi:hypothetical protein